MEHVNLGRTGLLVSRLCLGTMTFGLQSDETTARAVLDRAAEGGVTFIDTADVYPAGGDLGSVGRTEEIVGRWLRGRRDEFVLATKCVGRTGRRAWDAGSSRKHILDAVDASLRRLDTDYIDLYQLHAWDPATPLDETVDAMDQLVQSGKVRYLGVSNWLAWHLALALGHARATSRRRFDVVQPRYNLLFREFERELFPLCESEGIGVIPYNPIAGGLLSGKHRRSEPPSEGTRFTLGAAGERYRSRYWSEWSFDVVDRVRAVADEAGFALPTLAVAWVLANPAVTSPIIGASRPDQLDATLAAADVTLDAEVKARLDDIGHSARFGDAPR